MATWSWTPDVSIRARPDEFFATQRLCTNIRSAGEARMATAGRNALPRPLRTRRDHGPPGCARTGRKTGRRRLRDKASLGPQHVEKLQMRARRLPGHAGGDAVAPAQ